MRRNGGVFVMELSGVEDKKKNGKDEMELNNVDDAEGEEECVEELTKSFEAMIKRRMSEGGIEEAEVKGCRKSNRDAGEEAKPDMDEEVQDGGGTRRPTKKMDQRETSGGGEE